jgi:xanthine dehydrogenase accessory factor
MNREILELARNKAARGEPFVLASVVWRRTPSSGKEGSTALIDSDGRVHGWLGGACAEPAVIRESLTAMREGTPRLMFLGRPEELREHDRDGVVTVPIACQSEGALEVYVEPVLPQPQLVAIGRSPAVDALVSMADALGWGTVLVDDGGAAEDHPRATRVLSSLDLSEVTEGSFVVVATQGHYDEDALQRALETPARYVGLVASRKRAESVLGYLRDRGVPDEALARVRAPAGLDLGPVAHEEIAVAIMAELVREKTEAGPAPAAAHPEPEEAVDPVCGMTVEVVGARHVVVNDGRTYYFCSAGCMKSFEADPARYVAAAT